MYMGSEDMLKVLLSIKRELLKANKPTKDVSKAIHNEMLGLRNRYRESKKYKDDFEWHMSDFDSVWGKAIINRALTPDEIDALKDELWCHWYNPYNDGRDCTGVWFTSWIRVFVVNEKTLVYHRKSMDC